MIPEGYPSYWPPEGRGRFRVYYSDINQKFNFDVFNFSTGDIIERIITVEYIHQLQNLFFSLTGEELVMG